MMPLRICILWVFSTLFALSISNAQEKNYRFLHLDVNEGLSQGSVFAIEQDHLGFMWIGTRDGLNKYDAHKFTIYRSNPQDSLSLEHNFIQAITQDKKQRLWVGTTGGLNLYNRNADNFTRIPLPVVEKHKWENRSECASNFPRFKWCNLDCYKCWIISDKRRC